MASKTLLKKLMYASVIIYSLLLFGGMPAFFSVVGTENRQLMIQDAKMIALSPAALFLYGIGLAGIWVIYVGGVALQKDLPDAEKFARRRMLIGINFLGICFVGLEVLLRIGFNAI